jgi:hypothetical protein
MPVVSQLLDTSYGAAGLLLDGSKEQQGQVVTDVGQSQINLAVESLPSIYRVFTRQVSAPHIASLYCLGGQICIISLKHDCYYCAWMNTATIASRLCHAAAHVANGATTSKRMLRVK